MVLRGALNGLFSFRAVLRTNDDFPDAFGDRYQAIAAGAARAPNLELHAAELGHGNGFFEAFGEAKHVPRRLPAYSPGGVADPAECPFRLPPRRGGLFPPSLRVHHDPLPGELSFIRPARD